VIVVKLDLNPVVLQALTLAIAFGAGFLLCRQGRRSLGAVFVLGAVIAIVSVSGLLTIVAMIEQRSIVPSSLFEWQEAVEYIAGLLLATFVGGLVARSVPARLPLLSRRGSPFC
jgi:uncharacterized integral membrane protein